VVGDGGNWIEPLGQRHFPGWVQVLDFLHLLVHLYAAATAAYRNQGSRGVFRAWRLYERMLRVAGAEAILQGRAAYLSEDGRGDVFYTHRPRDRAVGRNRLRLTT